MPKWRWPSRKPGKLQGKLLGKLPPARRPVPLASGEIAGSQSHVQALLAQAPAFRTPHDGQIVVAEEGNAALAVEGCMAISGGGIAVRGWLTDPHRQFAGLWLEIDGALQPAKFASHLYRQDVLEQRALMEAYPGYRAGYYLFETCDPKPGNEVVVKLHAVTEVAQGYIVLSSGIAVTAGSRCSLERLANEFEAGSADAATIASVAEPFLKGLASGDRTIAWRDRRIEAGTSEAAELAVVIVVQDNLEMLHHMLAALEACGHAARLEVILTLQSPAMGLDVSPSVRAWRTGSPFAGIKTLVPVLPIGFGLAASGGVEFAQAPAIAVACDEILPPNGNWVGAALEEISADPQSVLIPPITTFDHRPFTFGNVFDLTWADFEHDHSGLRDLASLERVRNCLEWGSGFLVAAREVFDRTGGLDDSLSYMDLCLLDFVYRLHLDGVTQLKALPRQFTHLRLPGYKSAHPARRLWSLYALAATIRRSEGHAAPAPSADVAEAVAQSPASPGRKPSRKAAPAYHGMDHGTGR